METPTTARLWDANGLDYDNTLSYTDHPGFRCGTGREHPLDDVVARGALRLSERPLIPDGILRDRGLDHRLVQLLVILASSGLPVLIRSGQDGLTTHSVAAVGEGMIEAVIAKRYLGRGYIDGALNMMLKLKARALRSGADFTLLWHALRPSTRSGVLHRVNRVRSLTALRERRGFVLQSRI